MTRNLSAPIRVIDYKALDQTQRNLLCARIEEDLSAFKDAAAKIIADVKARGDAALLNYTNQFDAIETPIESLQVTQSEIDHAFTLLDDDLIDVLRYAAENIRKFHQTQMPKPIWMQEIRAGVYAGERISALGSVALYSPRGKGSFPSVTLMTAIPAMVAGVKRPMIFTPPGADGSVDPATLVAASIAGVTEIYKIGGAQAVAAAAFGTNIIPACVKIEGPGSPYFMAAKALLQNKIDIGLPAGPSEVIVYADTSVDPRLAAMDVIIESEHGADSSAYLVTTDAAFAREVAAHIPELWAKLSDERAGYSHAVLSGSRGGIVIADSLDQAFDFINDYAPEHLQLLSDHAMALLERVENAGEILMGPYSPGTIANYMMGPNCVLPTAGAAKTYSALSVHNFLKTSSIGQLTRTGLAEMAPKAQQFAAYEGFDGHALAVSDLRWEYLKNRA